MDAVERRRTDSRSRPTRIPTSPTPSRSPTASRRSGLKASRRTDSRNNRNTVSRNNP